MPINAYVIFNGNCRQAVEFYAEVFQTSKPQIVTYGEGSPDDAEFSLPEEFKSKVMHTELIIDGSTVMFSDAYPGKPFVAGNNISLTLGTTDLDVVKHAFSRLAEGGTITMELQETSWSKYYGMLTDKFGIEWQFNYCSGQA